jgi:hypothetical protein
VVFRHSRRAKMPRIDTRRSVHLAADGAAFVFEPPDRYRRFRAADVFAELFAPLPLLAGVTDQQIAASKAALERLSDTHVDV